MDPMIYLDHAATTPLAPEALDAMLPWLTDDYASASTLYTPGRRAAQAVEAARESVARLIGAAPEELVFTSGGSEANNWAVFGAWGVGAAKAARVKTPRRAVASAIEHHSVIEPCRALALQGAMVSWIAVDGEGLIDPARVAEALTPQAALLCLMHANNEIGTIQPVEAVGRIARERGVHYHVDAIQTAGHLPVAVAAIGCDTLSLAAHKIGGPKGIGALYIRKGVQLEKFMHGGAQEGGRRAGTQNVAAIAGFGRAAALARERLDSEAARLATLRDALIAGIEARIPNARLNGHRTRRLPGNVNFSFEGIASEDLILRLDLAGVCASFGSACAAGSLAPSHVLLALGLPPNLAHAALRLTLGQGNDAAQVERVLALLPGIIERLRE